MAQPAEAEELLPDQAERLRAAFAKLMLQGQGNAAVPLETLWAGQAAQQNLRAPPPPPLEQNPDITNQYNMPMPQAAIPKDLNFPTADPAGTQQATMQASKPFPGAQSVEVKPYGLPPSNPKKKAKNG